MYELISQRRNTGSLALAVALSMFVSANAPYEVQAQDASTTSSPLYNDVDLLTRKILATEFELQRLNTHFRIESTHQDKLRPWRQLAYAEANAGLTLAGLIEGMHLNYARVAEPPHKLEYKTVKTKDGKTVKKPNLVRGKGKPVPPGQAQTAQVLQMTGQFIGAAGDLFEMGLNAVSYWRQKKAGFDPGTYRKRVQVLSKQLDDLMAQREQALANSATLSQDQIGVARAEGKILKDVRDLTMLQYTEYHSAAQRLRFFQNAAYAIDFAKNTIGATGNIIILESSHLARPRMVGGAGIFTLTSGVLIVLTPIFGRVTGNLAGLVDRCIVNRDFANAEARDTNAFIQHNNELEQLMVSAKLVETGQQGELLNRKAIYDREKELLVASEDNIKRERALAKTTTRENILFGSFVGATKISLGVCNILGGWSYYNKPWVAARLAAAGNTAYGAGSAFALFENARVRFQQESQSRHQKQEHVAPGQILNDRLASLEQMEKMLNVDEHPHRRISLFGEEPRVIASVKGDALPVLGTALANSGERDGLGLDAVESAFIGPPNFVNSPSDKAGPTVSNSTPTALAAPPALASRPSSANPLEEEEASTETSMEILNLASGAASKALVEPSRDAAGVNTSEPNFVP